MGLAVAGITVPLEDQFGVFKDDKKTHDGPVWRGFFHELATAKLQAQKFADEEDCEFFVFSFVNYSEVARIFPDGRGTPALTRPTPG